ncbi:centromere protein M-like isoform X2 [Montipora foliosa]|uniref:centromere protein M-like isoform X2 n=1 Tax=Montipora foliosa TaxID=591990 RepID=UPI0035F1F819
MRLDDFNVSSIKTANRSIQERAPEFCKSAKLKFKMADFLFENENSISRFAKLPEKTQATVLFVGVNGIGKHRVAKSLLGIHSGFSLKIRVCTSLPLSKDTDNTRSRVDFVVLFIDLANTLSFEVIKSAVKHMDIDYFLGHCCFVVTKAKNEAIHAVNIEQVTSLADSYDSPIICADLEKEEDQEFLSQKLIHLLKVSCGFHADVTTLLLDTTRKSFMFEDELIEMGE